MSGSNGFNEETTRDMLTPRKALSQERDVYKYELELRASLELDSVLEKDYCVCETLESKERKEMVLRMLDEVLLEWEGEIRVKKGILNEDPHSHVVVIPYGSYRFGVSTPNGDLDLLVAIPKVLFQGENFRDFREEHWNKTLVNKLKGHPEVQQLNVVKTKNAIINLEMKGTPIDLSLTSLTSTSNINARLNALSIDSPGEEFVEHLLSEKDQFLSSNMDKDARQLVEAFAGVQNCQLILKSFWNSSDSEEDYRRKLRVYIATLRAVKLFCKTKCIDSNKLGYMAGITLAILVAKALQWFPNLTPIGLLYRFFQFYGKFIRFGKNHWIHLESYKPEVLVFNRIKNERAMHVLTPSPTMPTNSTFNTKECNLKVFKYWMHFGFDTIGEIITDQQNAPGTNHALWNKLFEDGASVIFSNYNHFLDIRVLYSSYSVKGWVSACEAKLKIFIERFENTTTIDPDPFPIMCPFGKKYKTTDVAFKYAVSFIFPFKKCEETRDLLSHIVSFVKESAEVFRMGFYKDNGINLGEAHPEINMRILYKNRKKLEELLKRSQNYVEEEEKDEENPMSSRKASMDEKSGEISSVSSDEKGENGLKKRTWRESKESNAHVQHTKYNEDGEAMLNGSAKGEIQQRKSEKNFFEFLQNKRVHEQDPRKKQESESQLPMLVPSQPSIPFANEATSKRQSPPTINSQAQNGGAQNEGFMVCFDSTSSKPIEEPLPNKNGSGDFFLKAERPREVPVSSKMASQIEEEVNTGSEGNDFLD